jgi:chromosome segregation ATPase
MNPKPSRLADLRAQASRALAVLRELRDRVTRVLSDRRGLRPNDDRLPVLDAQHLALVRDIRAAESKLWPLQEQICELEAAQRVADAKEAAAQRVTAETEIAQAVKNRIDAASQIDGAAAALADAFRAWDAAGNVLARHEEIHGRAMQAIFSGRIFRAAIHAASEGTSLPRALELSRPFDGCATALEAEIDLWRKYLPAANAA